VKTSPPTGIVSNSHMIADPRKNNDLGEDAYFINGTWAGIADGVGGWRSQGVDPGKFSRALMQMLNDSVSDLGVIFFCVYWMFVLNWSVYRALWVFQLIFKRIEGASLNLRILLYQRRVQRWMT
jgi:hypothetical protein